MQKWADCLTPFYHFTAAESHFVVDNSESPAKILQDQFLTDFSKELTVNFRWFLLLILSDISQQWWLSLQICITKRSGIYLVTNNCIATEIWKHWTVSSMHESHKQASFWTTYIIPPQHQFTAFHNLSLRWELWNKLFGLMQTTKSGVNIHLSDSIFVLYAFISLRHLKTLLLLHCNTWWGVFCNLSI